MSDSSAATPVQGRAAKFTLLSALYIAQGLPFGFFSLALPVVLRDAGLSLTAISALGLLNLPWALKFLWAPMLDHVGSRKAWLLSLQLSAVLGALILSRIPLDAGLIPVIVAAFGFSIIAATQDIATDALAVRLLDSTERGPANAVQVGAYRIGMILGGGLLLFVFARSDWSVMFLCMSALLALSVVPVAVLLRKTEADSRSRPPAQRLAVGWLERAMVPGMLGFVGLIICFRFGDAMVSSLLGPFLKDQRMSLESIALLKGTVGSATSIIGAVLGGWFTARVERRFALLTTGLAQAATFVPYWVASLGIGGVGLLWTATILEGLIGTMATVALFTLMMDASDPEHAGTDYTLLACAYVVVTFIGSLAAGRIADLAGYPALFTIGTALAAVGTLALVFVLDRKPAPARVASVWTRRLAVSG